MAGHGLFKGAPRRERNRNSSAALCWVWAVVKQTPPAVQGRPRGWRLRPESILPEALAYHLASWASPPHLLFSSFRSWGHLVDSVPTVGGSQPLALAVCGVLAELGSGLNATFLIRSSPWDLETWVSLCRGNRMCVCACASVGVYACVDALLISLGT